MIRFWHASVELVKKGKLMTEALQEASAGFDQRGLLGVNIPLLKKLGESATCVASALQTHTSLTSKQGDIQRLQATASADADDAGGCLHVRGSGAIRCLRSRDSRADSQSQLFMVALGLLINVVSNRFASLKWTQSGNSARRTAARSTVTAQRLLVAYFGVLAVLVLWCSVSAIYLSVRIDALNEDFLVYQVCSTVMYWP